MSTQSAPIMPGLIVGLGNPGAKYDQTRHNVGFAAVNALCRHWQVGLSVQQKFKAEFGQGWSSGQRVRLLKPLTYMNHSGESVRATLDWFNLPVSSLLIISDDLDLPLGKLRLRLSGSAGGHNGLRSVIAHLGTQNFARLRVGIGQAPPQVPQRNAIAHVLGRLTPHEAQVLTQVLHIVVEATEYSLSQGVEKAMSRYNGQTFVGTTLE